MAELVVSGPDSDFTATERQPVLMAELVVSGPDPMQRWRRPIPEGEVIRLGRSPRSGWAVPWDALISREHTEIQLGWGGQLRVHRLEASRNPIYFEDADCSDFFLKPGESFRIGRTCFQFVSAELDEEKTRLREIIRSLPEILWDRHQINFRGLHCRLLQNELRDADSELSRRLADKFRRVILLELADGIGPGKVFDLDRFLPAAWNRIARVFELPFDPDTFHPEQIAQALKCEEAAAFCLLDVQLLSEVDLHRLRGIGFTQENHHILYVGNNSELGSVTYPVETTEIDDVAAIISSSTLTNLNPEIPDETPDVSADERLAALQNLLRACQITLDSALEALASAIRECRSIGLFLFAPGSFEFRLAASFSIFRDGHIPIGLEDDAFVSELLRSRSVSTTIVSPRAAVVSVPVWDSSGKTMGVLQLRVSSRTARSIAPEFLQSAAAAFALAAESILVREERGENEKLRNDIQAAQQVQQNLLPKRTPTLAGYGFAYRHECSETFSGDFWDFVRPAPDRLIAIIGDVAGKGMAAALAMVQVLTSSRVALTAGLSLKNAIDVVNREVFESLGGHRLATIAFVEFNIATHTLSVVNAGHLPPLLRRSNGAVEQIGQEQPGLPVGITIDSEYQIVSVPILPGDTLLLFTDGVPEAMNSQQQIYGLQKLTALLALPQPSAAELLSKITDDIHCFVGDARLRDDLCLVACARLN